MHLKKYVMKLGMFFICSDKCCNNYTKSCSFLVNLVVVHRSHTHAETSRTVAYRGV